MRWSSLKALSFDCYGTLIDWETGLWTALQPLLASAGLDLPRDHVLETFAELESLQQAATPGMRYAELLASVHAQLAEAWGLPPDAALDQAFGASVPEWPAFADAAPALAYFQHQYKLIILSNVDRASFAGSAARLGIPFDAVYTAEDIGCYKPDPRSFAYLIERLQQEFGLAPNQLLHVAQSLYHDHEPAVALGLTTAWIDRRLGQIGWGATKPPKGRPKIACHVRSLADLMALHQRALAEVR